MEFITAADAALSRRSKAPKSFPQWVGTEKALAVIRKAAVARFPYVIAFEEQKRHALALAVAHQKRRPLYWFKRTSQRRVTQRCSRQTARIFFGLTLMCAPPVADREAARTDRIDRRRLGA
jgi:hypothetical protein